MGQWGFVRKFSKRASRKGLYEFLDRELSVLEAGARVLNIGAGGEIQRKVEFWGKRNGFHSLNSDIDPDRIPDVVDDVTNSSFESNRFDVVVISEVLEHVRNPFKAVAEMHRVLRPGGKLILTCPFIFPLHDRPYDFFRYTKYGLKLILVDFEEVEIQERNSWAEALLVLMLRLPREPIPYMRIYSILLFVIAVLNLPVIVLATKILPTDYLTTGYTVVGRKSHLL